MIVLGREISKFAENIITETQKISSKKLIFINTNNKKFYVKTDKKEYEINIDVTYAGKYFETVLLHEVRHIWQLENGFPQFGYDEEITSKYQQCLAGKMNSLILDLNVDKWLRKNGYFLHDVTRKIGDIVELRMNKEEWDIEDRMEMVIILIHIKYYNTKKEFKNKIRKVKEYDPITEKYYREIYQFIETQGIETAEDIELIFRKIIEVFQVQATYCII